MSKIGDKIIGLLAALLGREAATALRKTADREPDIAHMIVPRVMVSWLSDVDEYNGTIPGMPNTQLRLRKSNGLFGGTISCGDVNIAFDSSTPEYVAAAVCVGLGIQGRVVVKDGLLAKAGQSIDLLVKAQKKKRLPKVRKADAPGKAAGPQPPNAPKQPQAPGTQGLQGPKSAPATPKAPKTPKAPSPAQPPQAPKPPGTAKSLELSFEQLKKATCDICGSNVFKDSRLVGCMCIKDLAKSVKTTIYGDGVVLSFGADFDPEAYEVIMETLKL